VTGTTYPGLTYTPPTLVFAADLLRCYLVQLVSLARVLKLAMPSNSLVDCMDGFTSVEWHFGHVCL
jgi:hypothetical protein